MRFTLHNNLMFKLFDGFACISRRNGQGSQQIYFEEGFEKGAI